MSRYLRRVVGGEEQQAFRHVGRLGEPANGDGLEVLGREVGVAAGEYGERGAGQCSGELATPSRSSISGMTLAWTVVLLAWAIHLPVAQGQTLSRALSKFSEA